MSLLDDLFAASKSSLPFAEAWKRVRCRSAGHVFQGAKLVDKLRSEKHPHTDQYWIYTVNISECPHCGLLFHDSGLELRSENARQKWIDQEVMVDQKPCRRFSG